MNFEEQKKVFDVEEKKEEGHKIMVKVAGIVNDVGNNFTTMNGGDLSENQSKLAGYKFHLADYTCELNRRYESLDLELKHIRATEWDRIAEEIKSKEGKVKNKEQIENVLIGLTSKIRSEKILYETLYYKYKLKISSIDSIIMAISQRIKELQKQLEQQI